MYSQMTTIIFKSKTNCVIGKRLEYKNRRKGSESVSGGFLLLHLVHAFCDIVF